MRCIVTDVTQAPFPFSLHFTRDAPAAWLQSWYDDQRMTSNSAPPFAEPARSETASESSEVRRAQATHHGGYASEELLVEALKRRETRAFEELCRRHIGRVRIVLYRVLGSDSEVQDLAQEAVLCAMKAAPKFRGNASQLGAWLTSIAVNTARDNLRRRTLVRRFFSRDEDAADEAPAQLASVEQIQTVKRTYRVLSQMSADDRIAFSLRVIDKMTMEEVARACDVSVSTAKRRVEKARKRFSILAQRDPNLRELLEGGAS